MSSAEQYFENLNGNCKECLLNDYCAWYRCVGNPKYDPLCANLSKEEQKNDIYNILKVYKESLEYLEKKEDKIIEKERLKIDRNNKIQEKRRITLAKNREINRVRTVERRKKREEKKLKGLYNLLIRQYILQ